MPFSKIVFMWGDPIYIKRDASPGETESKRIELEKNNRNRKYGYLKKDRFIIL